MSLCGRDATLLGLAPLSLTCVVLDTSNFKQTYYAMPSLAYVSALFGALAIVSNPTAAGPVRHIKDFHFKSGPNHSTCSQAHGTKYSVGDKDFGILCGWDTRARGHKYGAYFHLNWFIVWWANVCWFPFCFIVFINKIILDPSKRL